MGTYRWEEFAAGDPGSNQSIVHELVFTGEAADGSLTGVLTEVGFQTDISVPVTAYGAEGGITIFAAADNDGLPLYTADQRLFALIGDPAAPTTELAAVQPFLGDVPQTRDLLRRHLRHQRAGRGHSCRVDLAIVAADWKTYGPTTTGVATATSSTSLGDRVTFTTGYCDTCRTEFLHS